MNRKISLLIIASFLIIFNRSNAQKYNDNNFIFFGADEDQPTQIGQNHNAITTAVPFLTIAPDARSGALGDAGVAISPDVNSIHWNAAKYIFMKKDFGINVSYIPWLQGIVADINFSNLSTGIRIDKNQSIGFSLMYFSLGEIVFRNMRGDLISDQFKPHELSLDGAYALRLGEHISGGIALRYTYSNLTGGFSPQGADLSRPGQAVSGDLSFFYTKDLELEKMNSNLSAGVQVSNIGSKVSYGSDSYSEFLPANLRLGVSYKLELDQYNSLMATLDLNKLLVPTPPYYDAVNTDSIVAGMDDDVSPVVGMFQSFYDAPGYLQEDGSRNVVQEEVGEIMYSFGMEYIYNNIFAVRAGYFHETYNKGGRKFFTAGVGVKLNVLELDFAYLIPTQGANNPLANTLRFTLGVDVGKLSNK